MKHNEKVISKQECKSYTEQIQAIRKKLIKADNDFDALFIDAGGAELLSKEISELKNVVNSIELEYSF